MGVKVSSSEQAGFTQFLSISLPKALQSALILHREEIPLLLENSLLYEKSDHLCTYPYMHGRMCAFTHTHTLCMFNCPIHSSHFSMLDKLTNDSFPYLPG